MAKGGNGGGSGGGAGGKFVAVAFTDVNGDHKFNASHDTLIAGVIDTNRDGTVSVGDTLTWGKYPTQIDGQGTFGTFGAADYNIVDVGESLPPGFGLTVQTGPTTQGFIQFVSGAGSESFSSQGGASFAAFSDDFALVGGQDAVNVTASPIPANNLPGLQDTPANDIAFHPGNDGFLDIFIV